MTLTLRLRSGSPAAPLKGKQGAGSKCDSAGRSGKKAVCPGTAENLMRVLLDSPGKRLLSTGIFPGLGHQGVAQARHKNGDDGVDGGSSGELAGERFTAAGSCRSHRCAALHMRSFRALSPTG